MVLPGYTGGMKTAISVPNDTFEQATRKAAELGISDRDAFQGSELAYTGPEVTPLALVAHGPRRALRRLTHTLHPKAAPTGVGRRARPPDPSDPGLPATHEPVPG